MNSVQRIIRDVYVTGNVCNQGIHVIPNQVREFT